MCGGRLSHSSFTLSFEKIASESFYFFEKRCGLHIFTMSKHSDFLCSLCAVWHQDAELFARYWEFLWLWCKSAESGLSVMEVLSLHATLKKNSSSYGKRIITWSLGSYDARTKRAYEGHRQGDGKPATFHSQTLQSPFLWSPSGWPYSRGWIQDFTLLTEMLSGICLLLRNTECQRLPSLCVTNEEFGDR